MGKTTYDAVMVGSGVSGGLTRAPLKFPQILRAMTTNLRGAAPTYRNG